MGSEKSVFDLRQQNQFVEDKIVASLERISEAFRVLLWEESKQNGLSPIQIQILIFLLFHSAEKSRITYLATEFNMTKATISDAVKVLEKKKLVVRAYDENDNRSFTLTLSRAGKTVAEKSSMFANVMRKNLEQIPVAQKQSLLNSLLTMIGQLNQAGIISTQRMCVNCRYFTAAPSKYCHLMQKPLQDAELQVDCGEHVPKN